MLAMSDSSVMVASLMRERPQQPELPIEFFDAILGRNLRPEDSLYLALHLGSMDELRFRDRILSDLRSMSRSTSLIIPVDCFQIPASTDTRVSPGPRVTGETQENLAFLRNKCLRAFARSLRHKHLLLIDSDIILAPGALAHMVQTAEREGFDSLSLLVDTNHHTPDEPMSNAMIRGSAASLVMGANVPTWVRWTKDLGDALPASYRRPGNLYYVHRTGACTLYSRRVLDYRFNWQPGDGDEQDRLMIEMQSRLGLTCHWFDATPGLCDHRRAFAKSLPHALEDWLADPRSEAMPDADRRVIQAAEQAAHALGKELTVAEVRALLAQHRKAAAP